MKFIDILEENNIPTAPQGHHHRTQGWIQFDCPFCGRDSGRFHMGYNLGGGFANCWRCGPHSLYQILQELTGLHHNKIKSIISQLDEVVMEDEEKIHHTLILPSHLGPLGTTHIRYINKRHLHHLDLERLWQVQGIGFFGRLKWRLFIPIIYKGRMVSWTTRTIGETGLRYISAQPGQELMPHKTLLYGQDYVRHTVIVVEGPMDVWAIGPGAVATFGTAYTKSQVAKLIEIPRRIVCYDNEPEAQKQAQKLCNELGGFGGETINVVLNSKDPGEAKPAELNLLRTFLER